MAPPFGVVGGGRCIVYLPNLQVKDYGKGKSLYMKVQVCELVATYRELVAEHKRLGETMVDRIFSNNQDEKRVSELVVKILRTDAGVQTLCKELAKSSEGLHAGIVTHMRECFDYLKSLKICVSEQLERNFVDTLAGYWKMCRGGFQPGDTWSKDVESGHEIEDPKLLFTQIVPKTILSREPSVYKAAYDAVESMRTEVAEKASFYQFKVKDEFEKQMNDLLPMLGLTYVESLFCSIYVTATRKDIEVAKGKVHGIEKLFKAHGVDKKRSTRFWWT